jgi:LPS export ABC transporter permease LptF/LPS export ABC transporter permease LptG
MPWRVYRSVIKEIVPYFFLTLLIVTAIIFSHEMRRFSELFVKRNVPPALVRTLLAAVLTRILIITLPVSLLVGILLGLTRMSSDNEIISLFSSGISRKRLLIPVLVFSAVVSLFLGVLTLREFPRAAARFREIRGQLILQGIRTQVTPRVFDDRFVNKVLYIHDIDRKTDHWQGIFLASFEAGQPVFITGKQGILELGDQPESSELHLFQGLAHRLEKDDQGHEVYHLEGFSSYHVRFDPQSREAAKFRLEAQRQPEPIEEKSVTELLQMGQSSDEKLYIKARVEAGRRLALPLACLLFAPIGLVLGVLRKPAGRSAGFAVSIVLAAAYYLLLFAGEKMAYARLLPPFSAMWLANVVFAGLGALGLQERRSLLSWQHFLLLLSEIWRRTVERLHSRHRKGVPVIPTVRGVWRWLPWTKLVDQLLVTDFFRFFLLSLVSLWSVFVVFTLFELSPDIVEHHITMGTVAKYFFYLTPQVSQIMVPPCVLIASLLVMSLLTRTNQAAALKGSGVSAYRLSLPIMLACLALVVITSTWNNWLLPGANLKQDQLRFYIKKGHFPSLAELSPISEEGNWMYGETGRIFHFDRFDRDHDEFNHLWILDLNETDMAIWRRIEARRAVWDSRQESWLLEDGKMWLFDRDRVVQSSSFERVLLKFNETLTYFKKDVKKPEYMSEAELSAHIGELKRRGVDITELIIALERKRALPVACLVMGLFGVPFGFTVGRRGALYGVGLAIVLGLVYWTGLGFFEQLGRYGYVGPRLAGWGLEGLFGVLGGYFLFRVRT